MNCSLILPITPVVSRLECSRIVHDYERFRDGLPSEIESYLLESYGLDVSSRYGPRKITNPFGKASGQLSLNLHQVKADVNAGLGFVVLKTVIAENGYGQRSMEEWAIKETQMMISQIIGKETGEVGWNVTWQGRGWYGSLEEYITFLSEALQLGKSSRTVIVPSCKFHLPGPEESHFHMDEYGYTIRRFNEAWKASGMEDPLQLEKDFSPTLAGSDRARQQNTILRWLGEVVPCMRSALPAHDLRVGIKVMNTIFNDEFQIDALHTLMSGVRQRPDYIVYANRLYDHGRSFAGRIGAAYGGPDLSIRNLRILHELRRQEIEGELAYTVPILSGTGNIHSGKMALEYALRGVESMQMHTMFQKPLSAYSMRRGSKTERGLHDLYFHPETGLVAWMLHLRHAEEIVNGEGITTFQDIARWYRHQGRRFFQK
ncbi:Dihydroorotate dehydrogenase [Fontibacillus panacisegetis]|uniref:Dihydroorotate dehydrogenase n=1 Tax=Fontibacillus panacisegetis TaxID=670482 RepID=A0A1G7EI93_9BACL|nr:hypothetical protein [Fontibacillus panacisegetis]SDE63297.1 Dihydroorotate dehydrogenase [Fontibacillus panacisegetis]